MFAILLRCMRGNQYRRVSSGELIQLFGWNHWMLGQIAPRRRVVQVKLEDDFELSFMGSYDYKVSVPSNVLSLEGFEVTDRYTITSNWSTPNQAGCGAGFGLEEGDSAKERILIDNVGEEGVAAALRLICCRNILKGRVGATIISFLTQFNPMTIAHPIGIYLALWATFRGTDTVPFSETITSYKTLHTDSGQDLLGNFTIYVSMHGNKTAGQSFNIGDNDGVTWESTWAGICSYFGLKGTGPVDDANFLGGEKWVMKQKPNWAKWEQDHGLRKGAIEQTPWEFFTIILGYYSEIDSNLDLSLARKIGWNETCDSIQGYYDTFDRLRSAKMLPQNP